MAVSRKMGRAAARNRIKRVVREFFRQHQDSIPGPIDVVVVPKRCLDPERLSLAQATEEFAPLIPRLVQAAAGAAREKTQCAP